MALMENPASWGTQSPWEREESNLQFRQLPHSTTFVQDLTASTPAPPAPPKFTSLPGHTDLMLDEEQMLLRRRVHAAKLPVEILCFIFEILAANREASGLKNCSSTCRLWANVALPVLYRYCGFGIFEYMPPQPYRKENSYAAVPYSDFPFFHGRPSVASPKLVFQQACYWRTLLLSSLWRDELGARNATSYPYLQYVEHLDFLVLALLVNRYRAHRYRLIRNALFGVGTICESLMVQQFGNTEDAGFNVLSRMLNVLLPQVQHLKSANVFIEDDVTGSHAYPDKIFSSTIVQPVLETVTKFSRIVNLEISGQENLTPAFGRAIKAIRPSFIGPDNKTINKSHTFSLRITGARRVWAGPPEPDEEFHRNKGFLDALNENSVTLIDFDLTDDWEWNLDHISKFLIRQARTLKSIRLRGIGETVDTWQLLDRMGRRGCRVRALDLENRHVHHPPVIFEPTAWVFKTGLLKKLKYLAVEGFQGITNSTTNYHMMDPTSFSILLKHNLFGGKRTENRLTPPVKTLILNHTEIGSKVPEQIGAFAMHLAPTLTTLEIGYLSNGDSTDGFASTAHSREQGRFKLIDVLMKLTQLKRLKAAGYAAEVLLCSCIMPLMEEDFQDMNMGNVSRPRSPPRPPTPVGHNLSPEVASTDSAPLNSQPASPLPVQDHPVVVSGKGSFSASLNFQSASPLPVQDHPVVVSGQGSFPSHRSSLRRPAGLNPPALHLFTNIWRSSLEELELVPSGQSVFTVHGGLVDDTLVLFTVLQKLRLFTLLFGDQDSAARNEEDLQSLRDLRFEGTADGEMAQSAEVAAVSSLQTNTPGKITPDGLLRLVDALPRMNILRERTVMQKLWIGKRFMNPNFVAEMEKCPRWAVYIAEAVRSRGMEFVLA